MAHDDETAGPPAEGAVAEASRHERRARIFGDVLPEATSDEHGDAWGDRDREGEGAADEWLRRQVPPHHG